MTTDSLVHSLPQKKQTFACSAAGSGGETNSHTPTSDDLCVAEAVTSSAYRTHWIDYIKVSGE